MALRDSHHTRGFTLLELMVALAASAIVISAALSLLGAQQRMFRLTSDQRGVQETARLALDSIATSVRRAGLGLEPIFAFDFGREENLTMDRAPEGTVVAMPGYACGAAVSCRDSQVGPDELVFHSRDPQWMRPVSAVTQASITLAAPVTEPLHRGQMLLVMCQTVEMYWAYVTVGGEVATNATVVPLLAASGNDFGRLNGLLASPCFADTYRVPIPPPRYTRAYLVNRYRYFIRTFDPAGGEVPWGTAGARPYLMLDRGTTDAEGQPIEEVVAPDVEDLQVAYLFPRSRVGLPRLAGGTIGVGLARDAAGIDLAPVFPPPGLPLDHPPHPIYSDEPENREVADLDTRTTHHPSNIAGVQVWMVVRGASQESERAGDPVLPAAGNRDAMAGQTGFRRSLFQTTVLTPNLYTRHPYYPAYQTATDPELNTGGG